MANNKMKLLAYLTVVVIFLSVSATLYYGWTLFANASPNVKLGVLAAAVSVITFIYNNYRQQQREINSRHFVEKQQAYKKFFDLLFDTIAAQNDGPQLTQDQTIERARNIVKDLMVWGSAKTINEYNNFIRHSFTSEPANDLAIFPVVERLLRTLRSDLGHDDRAMEKLGLTKLIVKGDEHSKLDLL